MKLRVIACVMAATACTAGGPITKAGPPVLPATPAQVVIEEFAQLPGELWQAHTDAAEITIPLNELDEVTAERAGLATRRTLERLGFSEKEMYDLLHTRQVDGTRTVTSECCEASYGFSAINGQLTVTVGSL